MRKIQNVLFLSLLLFCFNTQLRTKYSTCRGEGEQCDKGFFTHYCCEGYECENYVCKKLNETRCDWANLCPDGYLCFENRCRKEAKEGDACDFLHICLDDKICFEGRCRNKVDGYCDWFHKCEDPKKKCFENRCIPSDPNACDLIHPCPKGFHCFDYRCVEDLPTGVPRGRCGKD